MLQDNIQRAGHKAHVAHAAVVSLHAFCCGLPILALMAAGLSSVSSTATLGVWGDVHAWLHGSEGWIAALSVILVAIGGVLEVLARRGREPQPFPWLFALSVACFAFNIAVILAHRAG